MTLLTVNYRHSAGFKPHYINNAAVEETANVVRAQLVSAVTDAITLSVLGDITGLNVNGIRFDLWISLDHPVSDHESGETVCGLCEFDPGAGVDAASLLVSPVSEAMTEELVLSTFGHELGHAVFEAPGWIAGSKAGPGLFDDMAVHPLKVYRMTTRDAAHLSCAGTAEQQNPPATVHETERAKAMRIAEYRANEFMGSLLVPRSHLLNAVNEMASMYHVMVVHGPSLLDGQLSNSVTLKADGDLGDFDLEGLQKAIGKRFGVHGRFIRVRMERYGLLPGNRPH